VGPGPVRVSAACTPPIKALATRQFAGKASGRPDECARRGPPSASRTSPPGPSAGVGRVNAKWPFASE
jgi:hypothetical protein